jgi:hypothetical protein
MHTHISHAVTTEDNQEKAEKQPKNADILQMNAEFAL